MGTSSSNIYCPPDERAAEIDNLALDTNIFLLPYSIIQETKSCHIHAPHFCRGCKAILNVHSILHSSYSYHEKMKEDPLDDRQLAEEEDKMKNNIEYYKGKFIRNIQLGDVVWICEFCDVHNKLPSSTVLPQNEKELYLVKKSQSSKYYF